MVGYEEDRGAFLKRMLVRPQTSPRKRGEIVDGPFTVYTAIPSPIVGEVDHGLWTAWLTVTGPCLRSNPNGL